MRVFILYLVLVCCAFPASSEVILKPRLKPVPPAAGQVAAPEQLPIAFPKETNGWPKGKVQAERRACTARLKGLDITYSPLPPLGQDGGCGTAAPILISAISGISISPPAEANCALAEALFHWINWSVVPAAKQHLKRKLVSIGNASAYVCRRRNNAATGKMSEHAIANALDISTLTFDDGPPVTIGGDWGKFGLSFGTNGRSAFLKQIRRDSCIRFTTVLGPGSDKYHGDHFHVDLAYRRSGFRICK
jgi:hypothetical protein